MVKCTNGLITIVVTSGAFKSIFEGMGYRKIEDANSYNDKYLEDQSVSLSEEGKAEKEFVDEMVEKPIGEWSKSEVKKFAEIKKINISGTKSVSEAKAIIKEYIDSSK